MARRLRGGVEAGTAVPGRGALALVVDQRGQRQRRHTLGTPGCCRLQRAALVVQPAQGRQLVVLSQFGLIHSAPEHTQRLVPGAGGSGPCLEEPRVRVFAPRGVVGDNWPLVRP